MFSTTETIHTAFDFLLARGYAVVAESDGAMAGTVAYRSPLLWISLEWERGNPTLSFTLTRTTPNSFAWTLVDRVLNGELHLEFAPNVVPSAPVAELATFLRANLDELERRLSPPECEAFEAHLRAEQGSSRQQLEEFQRNRKFR